MLVKWLKGTIEAYHCVSIDENNKLNGSQSITVCS